MGAWIIRIRIVRFQNNIKLSQIPYHIVIFSNIYIFPSTLTDSGQYTLVLIYIVRFMVALKSISFGDFLCTFDNTNLPVKHKTNVILRKINIKVYLKSQDVLNYYLFEKCQLFGITYSTHLSWVRGNERYYLKKHLPHSLR